MVFENAKRGSLLDFLIRVYKGSLNTKKLFNSIKYKICAHSLAALVALRTTTNLCHKDIKPDNLVLLDDNEEGALVGLIDFAYCVHAGTNTKDKRGTPIYAPPEAFEDGYETVDPEKFDVFMLGCLFITILF